MNREEPYQCKGIPFDKYSVIAFPSRAVFFYFPFLFMAHWPLLLRYSFVPPARFFSTSQGFLLLPPHSLYMTSIAKGGNVLLLSLAMINHEPLLSFSPFLMIMMVLFRDEDEKVLAIICYVFVPHTFLDEPTNFFLFTE